LATIPNEQSNYMKKKIALLAGGYSGEFVVSLNSAKTIREHLDPERYAVYLIVISREEWYYDAGNGQRIPVDKNDFSIFVEGQKIIFDMAFIVLHGSPGEDGKLQGYFDMLNIPYNTCNALVSALTFNKSFCNKVVRDFNIVNVARSVLLQHNRPFSLGITMEKISLPVFVKPNESGSSLGTSKVITVDQLLPAIERAFEEGGDVLIEEYIEGRELTIGVYEDAGKVHLLPPTEIVSKNEFFDFEAKYTPGITNEITPADLSETILEQLNEKAATLYTMLNCNGVVRIDFILKQPENILYFLEMNTTPGQSEASIIPQQVIASGSDLKTFYGNLLENALNRK